MDIGSFVDRRGEIGRILPSCGLLADAESDVDAGSAQSFGPATTDQGKGIAQSDNDATDAGAEDGIRAGRCLAVVAAGFEGDVKSGPTSGVTGTAKGVDLGMGAAIALMPAFANELSLADDDGTDQRVRLDKPSAPFRQLQCSRHPAIVVHCRLKIVD